ncbi:uncharacterized protein LOC109491355 isoform X5 [Felis catus]|uniref:uncharacterized protein LOC109491355 isoform X5 n=1 Tax=Felis catus TaxID=9685 RepID=UPI0003F19892|nr:uncharacterized protein LOC109491355 isoform X5 [Felis catus]
MQAQSGRASLTKPGSGTTMNAPNTRASSGNLQQQQLTGLPGQSAAAVQASRSGQGSRSRQSSRSGQPTRPANPAPSKPQPAVARAQPAVSKTPPGKQQQVTQSAGEKAAIQKRAEEQAKVPFKFRDSFKQFFFLPTGVLKILRLDLINSFITAVFLLIVAILAMQEMERRHLFYVGGSLCLTAAIGNRVYLRWDSGCQVGEEYGEKCSGNRT